MTRNGKVTNFSWHNDLNAKALILEFAPVAQLNLPVSPSPMTNRIGAHRQVPAHSETTS
jgi:hypothetical protein